MVEGLQKIQRLWDASAIAAICQAHTRNPKPPHTPRLFVGSDESFWVLCDEFHTWNSYGGEHATPETLAVLATAKAEPVPTEFTSEGQQ